MTTDRESEGKRQGEIRKLNERIAELEARLADREFAAAALDVNDQLLDALTDMVPTALFVYQDGGLVYANRIAFELVGLDMGRAHPNEVFNHLDDEYKALVKERADARIRGETAPAKYEVRLTRPTGEKMWLLMRVRVISFRGRPASLAAAIDITDRKAAEEELRASQANLAAIFENTSDYILLSDNTGTPVYFNSAYAAVMKRLIGLDMKPGVKPHELLPDPVERAKWDAYHRRVLGGEQFTVEYSFSLWEGDPVHLEVSYYPVKRGDEIVGFCEFTHDVTERKHDEARLARIQKERAVQLRQIAGGLSHEIHNALFPANTTLHQLRDRLEKSSSEDAPRNLRLLDLGLRSLQRAMDLTESVRLFSKLDRFSDGEMVDLNEIIASVINQQYNRLREAQVTVSVDIQPAIRVRCPSAHLHSAFDNLVVNAADAMQEVGGGNLTIVARLHEETVTITIADTGPGIAEMDLEHVFEPFYTTKTGHGTGLGLAIVKRVVDLSGGRVTVKSEPGSGTTFAIQIPGDRSTPG